jgi:hypothetical protein
MAFLISAASLLVLLAVGIAAIVKVRRWMSDSSASADHWESTVADYRNLRNKGVLSEEEYRKIKTLVEPSGRGSVSSRGEDISGPSFSEWGSGGQQDRREHSASEELGAPEEGGHGKDAPPA